MKSSGGHMNGNWVNDQIAAAPSAMLGCWLIVEEEEEEEEEEEVDEDGGLLRCRDEAEEEVALVEEVEREEVGLVR